MTIRNRLYLGFGSTLLFLTLLLLANLGAGLKERSARNDASTALEGVRTVELVRYHIMRNRLDLNNFLLSGDPRDEEKVSKGLTEMADLIKRGEAQSTTESLRSGLLQVESLETNWADNFAKPLLAKRHQVDSGDATVSDLQIFYLQKDPGSWLTKSSVVLDQTAVDISKSSEESSSSATRASKVSFWVTTGGTLVALGTWRGFCISDGAQHHGTVATPDHRGQRDRRFRRPRSEHRYPSQR